MSNTASNLRIQEKKTSTASAAKSAGLSLVKPSGEFPKNKVMIRKRKASAHPLRDLRIQASLTLEELAEITQMSPSYLSRLESGSRRLNADIIQRLAVALSCNPGELLPPNNFIPKSTVAAPQVTPKADLPLYILQTAEGSKTATMVPTSQDQWMLRPHDFLGVQDAFACAVKDATWAPRYRAGDSLLVHPTAPLKEGCTIIVTTNTNETYIGTFQGCTGPLGAQTFTFETSFSKTVETQSFPLKEIKAYRITGTVEAA